jgi:hypothetical protein
MLGWQFNCHPNISECLLLLVQRQESNDMKRRTSSIQASRLLPIFDYGLLLMLMTSGTGALAWINKPTVAVQSEPASPRQEPTSLKGEIAALQETIERLSDELTDKMNEARKLQTALDNTPRHNLDAVKKKHDLTQNDLDSLQRRIEGLKQRLAQLLQEASSLQDEKSRLRRLRGAIDQLKREITQLAAELEQLKRLNTDLQENIDRLRATPIDRPTVRIDCDPQFQPRASQEAVDLMLWDNEITPIRPPYYKAVEYNGLTRLVADQPGENIDRALAPGSKLRELLDEADAKKQYVLVFVNSSSFDGFRRLRALLQERGTPFGWEPTHARNMISGSSTSGEATRRGVMSGGSGQ